MSSEEVPEIVENAAAPEEPKNYIPLSEISKHNTAEDCWLAINGKVYNVTNFLDQHPGGDEVILECAGTDCTQPFDEIGHSDQAIEMLDDMYVGEGNPEELTVIAHKSSATGTSAGGNSTLPFLLVCTVVAVVAYLYYKSLAE